MINKFSSPNISAILGVSLLGLIPSGLATALWAKNAADEDRRVARQSAVSQRALARLQAGNLPIAFSRINPQAKTETSLAIAHLEKRIQEIQSRQEPTIAKVEADKIRMTELSKELKTLSDRNPNPTSEPLEKLVQSAEQALGLEQSQAWAGYSERWDGILKQLGGPLTSEEKDGLSSAAKNLDKEVKAADLPADSEAWLASKTTELNAWLSKLREERE